MLMSSKSRMGYTSKELDKIVKYYGIEKDTFNKALGINTCAIDKKGNVLTYRCDVERALYKLGIKDGVFHTWD